MQHCGRERQIHDRVTFHPPRGRVQMSASSGSVLVPSCGCASLSAPVALLPPRGRVQMSASVPLVPCDGSFWRLLGLRDVSFEGRAGVAVGALFVVERLALPVGIRRGYHRALAVSTRLQTKARRMAAHGRRPGVARRRHVKSMFIRPRRMQRLPAKNGRSEKLLAC